MKRLSEKEKIQKIISDKKDEKNKLMCSAPEFICLTTGACFVLGLALAVNLSNSMIIPCMIGMTSFGAGISLAAVGYDLHKTNKELKILETEKEMLR